MKTANSLITLILLMTAVFSVITSTSAAYASTNGSDEGGEEGTENGNGEGDEGGTEGDEGGGAPPTPPEAAAPAVSTEEEEEDEDRTFDVQCWNGELVDDINDCPVDEGNIVCDDGSFAIRISDCPTGSSPPDNNDANPYCDLVSDEYMQSGGFCHDRKDYYQGGPNDGLYPCNDGTDKEDWRDCKDVSGFDYN